jgi:hypothetical protein
VTPYPAKKQGYVHLSEKEKGKEKRKKVRSMMAAQPTTGPIMLHPHREH